MRPGFRKISFSDFRQNMSKEIQVVTRELDHLWLCFHGRPKCAIVPMRDEKLLSDLHGCPFDQLMERMEIDRVRTIRGMSRLGTYKAEIFEEGDFSHPPPGVTEEEYWNGIKEKYAYASAADRAYRRGGKYTGTKY